MDTNKLKKFAQSARRQLIEQVSARLEQVLHTDSIEIREQQKAVEELNQQIKESSRDVVVEKVAYTWFNRFCALRFMDLNHFTPLGIVSPLEGFTLPEILQSAKDGVINKEFKVDEKRILGILNGQIPSSNPQQEAYRLLLVEVCNGYHKQMPFLFPEINDYTELLMPADLLSEGTVLQSTRDALTPDACRDVEVIGWLYQFYISEKKDEVMSRKSAIPKEDIPAVTQLFTPHWIVRYLVENSLGRLWMLNHPDSKLVNRMDYYIKADQKETDFLKISSPEDIKICDPACGSGHMLTYAFDLLFAIYAERGYDPTQIPPLIINNNLFGIEIDLRAGQLAAFALMMKAREKDKLFFTRQVEPNICVMEDIGFSGEEVKTYMAKVGSDLFTQDLWLGLQQFENAKTFGSLIRPQIHDPHTILKRMQEKGTFEDLFLFKTNQKVQKVLEMVEYLIEKYHIVITNPPYLGNKGINNELRIFLKNFYSDFKSDLFSSFVIRCSELGKINAVIGIMSPTVWMYISSFEKLREFLIDTKSILSLIELPLTAFKGATVQLSAYVFCNQKNLGLQSIFIRLVSFKGGDGEMSKYTLQAIKNDKCDWFYKTATIYFKKIPRSPIAYWLSEKFYSLYENQLIGKRYVGKEGVGTRDDDRFLRMSWEVEKKLIGINKKWILTDKAGYYRKWFLGFSFLMDWENDGFNIKNYYNDDGSLRSRPQNIQYLFKEGVSWGKIGTGITSFRWRPEGYGFNDAAPTIFGKNTKRMLAQLNSVVCRNLLSIRGSTLNVTTGVIEELPILIENKISIEKIDPLIEKAISFEKKDWDSYEISCDFTENPLVLEDGKDNRMDFDYQALNRKWHKLTNELQQIEEENNRIFIEAYGLQEELTSDVRLEEITLTCNPHYRYGGKKSEKELEALLLADTMKEFISYGVGCMFGRYSLDKSGLILANQGETLEDYFKQVPQPSFQPDEDNAIPILEGEWFTDDITSRFKQFLKVTFGEDHFEENLAFLEKAIGKDIRSYFLRDFYNEHIKMYKKRPIYWMFSSPNGNFNTLIYLHRYQPDTVSIVLNQYLIPYREKLIARRDHLNVVSQNGNASSSDKSKAMKEINTINAVIKEMKEYEDEILYPLAMQQVKIDLDDGVKVNYAKLGKALKSVHGLGDE